MNKNIINIEGKQIQISNKNWYNSYRIQNPNKSYQQMLDKIFSQIYNMYEKKQQQKMNLKGLTKKNHYQKSQFKQGNIFTSYNMVSNTASQSYFIMHIFKQNNQIKIKQNRLYLISKNKKQKIINVFLPFQMIQFSYFKSSPIYQKQQWKSLNGYRITIGNNIIYSNYNTFIDIIKSVITQRLNNFFKLQLIFDYCQNKFRIKLQENLLKLLNKKYKMKSIIYQPQNSSIIQLNFVQQDYKLDNKQVVQQFKIIQQKIKVKIQFCYVISNSSQLKMVVQLKQNTKQIIMEQKNQLNFYYPQQNFTFNLQKHDQLVIKLIDKTKIYQKTYKAEGHIQGIGRLEYVQLGVQILNSKNNVRNSIIPTSFNNYICLSIFKVPHQQLYQSVFRNRQEYIQYLLDNNFDIISPYNTIINLDIKPNEIDEIFQRLQQVLADKHVYPLNIKNRKGVKNKIKILKKGLLNQMQIKRAETLSYNQLSKQMKKKKATSGLYHNRIQFWIKVAEIDNFKNQLKKILKRKSIVTNLKDAFNQLKFKINPTQIQNLIIDLKQIKYCSSYEKYIIKNILIKYLSIITLMKGFINFMYFPQINIITYYVVALVTIQNPQFQFQEIVQKSLWALISLVTVPFKRYYKPSSINDFKQDLLLFNDQVKAAQLLLSGFSNKLECQCLYSLWDDLFVSNQNVIVKVCKCLLQMSKYQYISYGELLQKINLIQINYDKKKIYTIQNYYRPFQIKKQALKELRNVRTELEWKINKQINYWQQQTINQKQLKQIFIFVHDLLPLNNFNRMSLKISWGLIEHNCSFRNQFKNVICQFFGQLKEIKFQLKIENKLFYGVLYIDNYPQNILTRDIISVYPYFLDITLLIKYKKQNVQNENSIANNKKSLEKLKIFQLIKNTQIKISSEKEQQDKLQYVNILQNNDFKGIRLFGYNSVKVKWNQYSKISKSQLQQIFHSNFKSKSTQFINSLSKQFQKIFNTQFGIEFDLFYIFFILSRNLNRKLKIKMMYNYLFSFGKVNQLAIRALFQYISNYYSWIIQFQSDTFIENAQDQNKNHFQQKINQFIQCNLSRFGNGQIDLKYLFNNKQLKGTISKNGFRFPFKITVQDKQIIQAWPNCFQASKTILNVVDHQSTYTQQQFFQILNNHSLFTYLQSIDSGQQQIEQQQGNIQLNIFQLNKIKITYVLDCSWKIFDIKLNNNDIKLPFNYQLRHLRKFIEKQLNLNQRMSFQCYWKNIFFDQEITIFTIYNMGCRNLEMFYYYENYSKKKECWINLDNNFCKCRIIKRWENSCLVRLMHRQLELIVSKESIIEIEQSVIF